MKFTSVAIVAAFLCVAVVSAAPSSPNPAFDVFSPLDKINQKIKEFLEKIKCARDVAEKEIGDSELKSEFEQFKATLDQLFGELKECSTNENKLEALKCGLAVGKKLGEEISAFTKQVAATKKELAETIRQQIEAQCLKKPELFELAEDTFAASAAEQFQCSVDYLGEISKANGLEELWSRTQPQLQLHLDSWKGCANAGNKYLVALCNIKEAATTFRLITEYMRLVATQNPKVLMDFVRGLPGKCSSKSFDVESKEIELFSMFDEEEEETQSKIKKFLLKIKCQTRAIDTACKGTKYQPIFDAHREAMFALVDGINECKTNSNKLKSAACIAKELKKWVPSLVPFFKDLAKLRRELPEDPELYKLVQAELSKCNV